MWYFNLDSSSGDGTHWIMWLKKCKNKFYFDSYGVQPPSELIAYLKWLIFYNSERVQQNGEGVLRTFMSLRIEAAFVGK